ncbi:IS66-like element accessory protein TnpA [Mesorhizobium cantuariense]|uniref:Transposase n=1 Tax=Mesorhizobium cantuariense TaxID=1300275 RepID=A0ABV7MXE2_9HYPH
MDTITTKNDFKLLEIVDTGRRRRFSTEAKRQIVEESFVSGDAVSAVARRHGLFPAQLFAWRRAARAGAFGIWNGAGAGLVEARVVPAVDVDVGHSPLCATNGGGRLEIVSVNGRRVIVEPDVDVEALLRVMRGLETLR